METTLSPPVDDVVRDHSLPSHGKSVGDVSKSSLAFESRVEHDHRLMFLRFVRHVLLPKERKVQESMKATGDHDCCRRLKL